MALRPELRFSGRPTNFLDISVFLFRSVLRGAGTIRDRFYHEGHQEHEGKKSSKRFMFFGTLTLSLF